MNAAIDMSVPLTFRRSYEPTSTNKVGNTSRFDWPCDGEGIVPGEERTAVRGLISRHCGLPESCLRPQLPLNRLGFSRSGLLDLAAAIDLEWGVYLSPEDFANGITVEHVAERITVHAA